jgi:hypothetical protein
LGGSKDEGSREIAGYQEYYSIGYEKGTISLITAALLL